MMMRIHLTGKNIITYNDYIDFGGAFNGAVSSKAYIHNYMQDA
jgi:hypothetical protein